MIRSFCSNAFIALWSIIMCLWGLLIALFDKDGRLVHFYCAAPWAKAILWVCGIKVHVTGRANLDTSVPRIYMTNHQSFFDIFALLACLPVDFKFILKQELMKIPLFGPAMRRAGYIGIEREDPRKAVKSMNQAAERIKNGVSVLIFPEGTRSPDGRLQPFKKGGFNLALKSGCDIVPLGINGSRRIAPKGSLKIKKGSFGFNIGKPIALKGYSKKNVTQLMDEVRTAMLRQTEEEGAEAGFGTDAKCKKTLGMILLITSLFWTTPAASWGYLMPVDQLVDKMRASFSHFETLIIDQKTHMLDPQDQQATVIFKEKVWLKSPGYCRTEMTGPPESPAVSGSPGSGSGSGEVQVNRRNRDAAFRRLFMVHSRDAMMAFLARMGINLEANGFTRLDGVVAYRVGDPGTETPRLLIHKETFRPILFCYVAPKSLDRKVVTVRFENYREVGTGWYPYKIEYGVEDGRTERYSVLDLLVNRPIEISFFENAPEKARVSDESETDRDGQEEERLNEVIQVLKEKYGD